MRATSAFVRLFIRGLAWDAEEAGATLDETLKIAARAKLSSTVKGKVLLGSNSAGVAVTYSLPPMDGLTDKDVVEVCSILLDKVDAIRAENSDIDDAQLVQALLAEFPTVRGMRPDFTTLQRF